MRSPCDFAATVANHVKPYAKGAHIPPFTKWLASLLGGRELDVQRVLKDPTALHFLIAWSLFESKCFSGFLKARVIREFAMHAVKQGFSPPKIREQFLHFHERYSGKKGAKALENLIHGDRTPQEVANEFKRCITNSPDSLSEVDQVFVVVFVIYRYRNNIFHGKKRVESWLKYRTQIEYCISAMQAFVSHEESQKPTLSVAEAA